MTARGGTLAKRWEREGDEWRKRSSRLPMYWSARHVRFSLGLPGSLAGDPHTVAVRGALAPGADPRRMRRLLHRDPETGDEPTLVDVDRRWLAVDLDGVPLPDFFDPEAPIGAAELEALAEHARSTLPRALREAACVYRWSGSAGFRPWREGLHMHMWWQLDRCAYGPSLAEWLDPVPHLDTAILRAAQPIFTADPVVTGGPDPLEGRRAGRLDGWSTVLLPLCVLRRRDYEAERQRRERRRRKRAREVSPYRDQRAPSYYRAALRYADERVRAACEGERHRTLVTEARSLYALRPHDPSWAEAVRATLDDAGRAVLPERRHREIPRALKWAEGHADARGATCQ